eukprot:jgi/Mesvir1/920/Mv17480-RA.1
MPGPVVSSRVGLASIIDDSVRDNVLRGLLENLNLANASIGDLAVEKDGVDYRATETEPSIRSIRENRLQDAIVALISSKRESILEPNSGRLVQIAGCGVCVYADMDESGEGPYHRVWQWHGHYHGTDGDGSQQLLTSSLMPVFGFYYEPCRGSGPRPPASSAPSSSAGGTIAGATITSTSRGAGGQAGASGTTLEGDHLAPGGHVCSSQGGNPCSHETGHESEDDGDVDDGYSDEDFDQFDHTLLTLAGATGSRPPPPLTQGVVAYPGQYLLEGEQGEDAGLRADPEMALEMAIVDIICQGREVADAQLQPNSRQSVNVGDASVCVTVEEQEGQRLWQWHGFLENSGGGDGLADDCWEDGYDALDSPKYVYGFYTEMFE